MDRWARRVERREKRGGNRIRRPESKIRRAWSAPTRLSEASFSGEAIEVCECNDPDLPDCGKLFPDHKLAST